MTHGDRAEMGRTIACQDQRLRLQHVAAAEQAQSESASQRRHRLQAKCTAAAQQAQHCQVQVFRLLMVQGIRGSRHLLLGRLVLTTNCSAVSARKSVTSSTAGHHIKVNALE